MKPYNTSLGVYKVLLVTLITSLSITGISYLDNKIWNLIMLIVGMASYSIVGLLFSIGILHGKNAGKEAYAGVFILLIILGYYLYNGIVSLQNWILGWSITAKIIIPIILGILTIGVIATIILIKRKK